MDQTELKLKIDRPLNILVRRRAAIGDVIMATGVVRELKKQYGASANIDVLTEQIEVFRNNPHIRNIYHTNAPPDVGTYDKYINLDDAYENNPENHYIDSYFYTAFGHTDFDKSVELFPSAEDQQLVDQDLVDIGDKFIVVHMRNWHWAAKNIAISTWLEIYTKLFTEQADFKIVCIGGSTDFYIEEHPLFVDARSKYNSQQLKYLCDHARAFVGIDSGPFQCAAASSTHIIGLLTHLLPERIMPFANSTAITTNEECRGCNDRQQRPIRQVVCQHGDYRCTSNWDTDTIVQAILEQLK